MIDWGFVISMLVLVLLLAIWAYDRGLRQGRKEK
jgi:hypothetical protein